VVTITSFVSTPHKIYKTKATTTLTRREIKSLRIVFIPPAWASASSEWRHKKRIKKLSMFNFIHLGLEVRNENVLS
jgi:hypothetical protein